MNADAGQCEHGGARGLLPQGDGHDQRKQTEEEEDRRQHPYVPIEQKVHVVGVREHLAVRGNGEAEPQAVWNYFEFNFTLSNLDVLRGKNSTCSAVRIPPYYVFVCTTIYKGAKE